jgi:predicted Zn finger-like uncharacterized protein
MKFVCDRCQTKYSIADERVRGKVLKVKCKNCANVISVREARSPSSGASPTLSAGASASRPRTGANAALSIPSETPGVDSERTQLAVSPFPSEPDPFPDLDPFAPPAPVAKRRPTGPIAPAAPPDDGVQWYMALAGARTGPFMRSKLVDRLLPLAKDADVHIWNERLDGWKPPADVAEVAADLSRRRAPPPLPGAPRRPTPPPIPPLGGLTGPTLSGPPQGQTARKPTGPHAPPSPVGHGPGGAGSKLPPPGGVHPALAARGEHGDPTSLLETPAPTPHMLQHPPGVQKTNGVGNGAGHAPPRPSSSDVMQMLNLPGGVQVPGAPPKLMSISSALGTQVAPAPRSRGSVLILAFLGVIALIVVVAVISLKKPPKQVPVVVKPPPPPAEVVAEKPVAPEPPPPPVVEPPPAQPPGKAGKKGAKQPRVVAGKGQPAGTAPGPSTGAGATGPDGDAARFRDDRKLNISTGAERKLPPPSQSDITRVISNNRTNIKVCYQRALTRDNTLTRGKLAVKLSIGISGRVKQMSLDGPAQFRILLEPCIKEVVSRWVFPQASEEYGTEFPLVFQGNE